MPKGNHRPSKKAALVVLSDKQMSTTGEHLKKLQFAVVKQIEQVRLLERESALRAVLCGIALHRVKGGLKHGEFLPWIKKSLKTTGRTQANNYMRLAAVAVVATKITQNQLQALPCDSVSLEVSDAPARRLITHLTKFVGEKSLNELLREHGIKDAAKTKPAKASGEASAEADPDVAAQIWREGISEWIESGHHQLIRELPSVKLEPTQARNIEASLAKLLADFRQTHCATLKSSAA